MEKVIKLDNYTMEEIQLFCGVNEENITLLGDEFQTDINVRGDQIILKQGNKELEQVIEHLLNLSKKHILITDKEILYAISLGRSGSLAAMDQLYNIHIARTYSGKLITPKTIGQKV